MTFSLSHLKICISVFLYFSTRFIYQDQVDSFGGVIKMHILIIRIILMGFEPAVNQIGFC